MISDVAMIERTDLLPRRQAVAVSFEIPTDHSVLYSKRVPFDAMESARTLLAALKEIHTARKVLPTCTRLAASMRRRGWSAQRLRSKYYEYLSGTSDYPAGDWRICLNKAAAPIDRDELETAVGRRMAFVEFWRTLGENFHQDWAAAHDELLKIWKTSHDSLGKRYTVIPGYSTWPQADAWLGHPVGWSYANLMRWQSDPYDQAAARIGHAKASQFRLPVLTTRVGLEFGQYLEFDDHEFNQRTLFQRRPMRPLGFGCVEVLSACICHVGLKPTLWDFEAQVKRKLVEREFMWFVVSVLTTAGYRNDIGTVLIVERGTAAIRAEFEERLRRVTNDKVTAFVGGRFGKAAHGGQFEGRSKGNYRTKALVEGSWALIDNQTAMLPAQTGRGRDDAPEGFSPQAGAEQYTGRILKAADAALREGRLTEEQAAQLQFPYPLYQQWTKYALDAFARVNEDCNHDLRDWEKLGFEQPVWRLPEVSAVASPCGLPQWLPWSAFLALPEAQRSVVKSMLDADASLLKTHRMSRQQVFNQHRKLLTPLPWELVPGLVGPENALSDPVEVKGGLLSFRCAEIDPDPIEFYARDHKAPSNAFLPNGSKFTCYVNPYAPTHLVACDAAGKVVAVCPRYIRACRSDEHAIEKLMGDQQAFEAAARVRLNLRHSDQASAKQAMIENNDRLLGTGPRGPEPRPPVSTRGISQDDFTSLDDPAARVAAPSTSISSQEDALNELD